MENNIIKFIKTKDYKFIAELGRGSCGKTVQLYDETIKEIFVCKKYEPYFKEYEEELFDNFIQEIKLLYILNHVNIVRIFNYYIYPKKKTGYILMEYIEGLDIETYLEQNPIKINNVFSQCIDGFLHLEKYNILHRDIRPFNILISNDGNLKIIDFGFSKKVVNNTDFDKSISLNLWCEPPDEFSDKQYDFGTEVYFVGKLFEKIIANKNIISFNYSDLLSKMCVSDPNNRLDSFSKVNSILIGDKFTEIQFSEYELNIYRSFSRNLSSIVTGIENNCKYFDNPELIQKSLEDCYQKVMLEYIVPSNDIISKCFLNGSYYCNKTISLETSELKDFIDLINSCSINKKNIIVVNILSVLDSIERYSDNTFEDDIPF